MPFAYSDGVRIYHDVVGDGPPLVLQHGYSLALSQWQHMGFVEPLSTEYRVILIDARGHGKSDKPHDPAAYSNRLMASDVVAVLDDLAVDKVHFCGFSMGGQIGFAVAGHYPDRLRSLVAGGASPLPGEVLDRSAEIAGLRQGMPAFVSALLEATGWQAPDWMRELMLANDPDALIALLTSRRHEPDEASLIPNMTMPCLVFSGEEDEVHARAETATQRMPNATFVSIEGYGHIIPPDLWLPILQDFLQDIENRR